MSETLLSETIALIAGHSELDAKDIGPDTELDELGIHSLELTEIIMELEEKYDVEIDLNTVEAWSSLRTVRDVVDKVGKIITSKSSSA
ncbi:MAG TPA: acyl carrier protein [Pararhizobium sp.]|nr:acyl carrier protein [Pararhizobium sp.]